MSSTKNQPKLHYFQFDKWMNDPNGLVKVNDEYHLFYQCNPSSKFWGNIGWGHAISQDLLTWEEQPTALFASSSTMIFSGSAITTFQSDGINQRECLMAFYTACDFFIDEDEQFQVLKQSQCIAYSTDNGMSWQHDSSNPILDINCSEFRDPKVIKLSENIWLMLVACSRDHKIHFYMSEDLKTWSLQSVFSDCSFKHGAWECPDLVYFKHDTESHWVLILSVDNGFDSGGSGTLYIIGDLINGCFVSNKRAMGNKDYLLLDKGADFFAPQSFFTQNDQDSPIIIGWLNNWQYAKTMPENNLPMMQSIPRSLSLKRIDGGRYHLAQEPVLQYEKIFETQSTVSSSLNEKNALFTNQLSGCFDCVIKYPSSAKATYQLEIHSNDALLLKLTIDNLKGIIEISRNCSGLLTGKVNQLSDSFIPLGANIDIRIIGDHYSFELFINESTEVYSVRLPFYFDNLSMTHKAKNGIIEDFKFDFRQ